MTAASLKAADILLIGRLSITEYSHRDPRPLLNVTVWCPRCKKTHYHSWGESPYRINNIEHRAGHCFGPGEGYSSYFIGLDPSHADHNKKVIAEFVAKQARYEAWKARQLAG